MATPLMLAGSTPPTTVSPEMQDGLVVMLAKLIATINETFSRMSQKTRRDTIELESRYTLTSRQYADSKHSQGNLGLFSAAASTSVFLSSFIPQSSDRTVLQELSRNFIPKGFDMFGSRIASLEHLQYSKSQLCYNQLTAKTNEQQSDSNVKESFKQILDSSIQLMRSATAPTNG